VLNVVVNDVLFKQPNLQCGCRCRAFTAPDGNFTFDLASVRGSSGGRIVSAFTFFPSAFFRLTHHACPSCL
jgi:hypothetical protein